MVSQANPHLKKKEPTKSTWVSQTLGQLSLEEKVGQMIMPAFKGVFLNNASPEFLEMEHQIRKNHVGGFILFAGDVYEAAALIDELQCRSKLPLFIASDFERGTNFRIRNTVSFPWNMAIGATRSENWAYLQGRITGQESRALGVNWIFAPDLDVNSNPSNPVINIRSYGEDPQLVANLGAAFVRGAQESGVLATGKHFPGHGDTAVDSHLALPVINADRHRLDTVDLVPFKRAIENHVWSIMAAHMAVPALEPNPQIPATLSSRVLDDLLQNEFGFHGLVVTDSLTMAALADGYWIGDAAVRAVKAGVDVLVDPPIPDVAYQAVLGAVQRGEISQQRLDRSVKKILEAKAWLGLAKKKRVDFAAIRRLVDDPKLQDQAQQMADASITLIRDSNNILPLDVRRIRSADLVLILGRDAQEDTSVFEQELRRRVEFLTINRVSLSTPEAEMEMVLERARKAEVVFCAVFARLVTGTGNVGLSSKLTDWIQRLNRSDKPVVTIALGNPYIIQGFPQVSNYLCTFSNADVSQTAAVKAIFGEIAINGKLPVSIPGIAEFGNGVDRERIDMRIHRSSQEGKTSRELRKRLEESLGRIVGDQIGRKAFPGASLAVGYRGELVCHKAFGKFSYSTNATEVNVETVYDLASLTKVITATTLAMQLFESGQLKLEYPLSRFFPSFTGEGKEKITIKHLLTHTSGLPAHLPFYKDTRGKEAFVQRILSVPLECEPGSKSVYSDLGIILLGDIIEKITGKPLDRLAEERIFKPLGMSHALFKPPTEVRKGIAPTENDPWRGRALQGEVHDENAYAMGEISAHAGLFANSGDLAIFCQMLLNGGVYDHHRVARRSTVERFTSPQDSPPGSRRALGWDTPSEGSSAGSLLSPGAFGHTGFTGTSIWIDPSRELYIILLTNRVNPTRENNAIQEARRQVADSVVRAIEGRNE